MMIEQPHGYLLDADGHVVRRFGNWETGEHNVPNAVTSVEYVDGPTDHTREVHGDYLPDYS
jgi:hypothetical protein